MRHGKIALMRIERRLAELGLELPRPLKTPGGLELPFPWVRLWHDRAFVSGHGPLRPDGSLAAAGKVGAEITEERAYEAARLAALAILASLRHALGDLDRVTGWLRVFGMVNTAPGFTRTPAVINGFSDLIIDLWGPDAGPHARSAIGVAELPFNIPVEIEAEVAVGLSAGDEVGRPLKLLPGVCCAVQEQCDAASPGLGAHPVKEVRLGFRPPHRAGLCRMIVRRQDQARSFRAGLHRAPGVERHQVRVVVPAGSGCLEPGRPAVDEPASDGRGGGGRRAQQADRHARHPLDRVRRIIDRGAGHH